jgi:pimeloyl-ACP methyl ester carboxylesterase
MEVEMSVQPFKVQIPQATLDDLYKRLQCTRWLDEVQGAGWDYGSNLAYLKALVDYWLTVFDWRSQEEALNRFAHFRATIDGFGIHFIHERGKGPNPLPILLTHGWPDSFFRMHKIIPLLTDPARYGSNAEDSFDVVVPSLPGYGFSDRPTVKGFTDERTAELFAKLMSQELGYKRFAAHGGDVGSGVTEKLAFAHAASLVGIHLTDIPYWHLFSVPQDNLSQAEQSYLEAGQKWQMEEGAYAILQSTKPQTLAYGLNDSPTGLAAWIIEKFRAWSDCNGDVENRFSKDELLTNIMIYWATETINSSFLPYYEADHNPPEHLGKRVDVPTGVAIFPKDLVPAPRDYASNIGQKCHAADILQHWKSRSYSPKTFAPFSALDDK